MIAESSILYVSFRFIRAESKFFLECLFQWRSYIS